MRGSWWHLSWSVRAGWALRSRMAKAGDAPAGLAWGNVAAVCAVVLLVALGVKWALNKMRTERSEEAQEAAVAPRDPEDLERDVLRFISQSEGDLVKLLAEVRKEKAKLAARHRRCKRPQCQGDWGESDAVKGYNVVVYDIAEED